MNSTEETSHMAALRQTLNEKAFWTSLAATSAIMVTILMVTGDSPTITMCGLVAISVWQTLLFVSLFRLNQREIEYRQRFTGSRRRCH